MNLLEETHAAFVEIRILIREFQDQMMKRNDWFSFIDWVQQASRSTIEEMRRFSTYLYSDWEAVTNAYHFSWNNGLVEGHVNRLKVIKRQMYGQANIDLLRQKFCIHCWKVLENNKKYSST